MVSDTDNGYDSFTDDDQPKSKTRVKQEMHALQDLGEELTHLNKDQLATIPLPDALYEAIMQAKGMNKREALRRQLQFIGKLMRRTDTTEIQTAYDRLREDHDRVTRSLHLIEQWRDDLINGSDDVITRFFESFPEADRQQLRNLVRGAKQEASQQKPPAQARKLFKFIRDQV